MLGVIPAAAEMPPRVRGTIIAVGAGSIVVEAGNGRSYRLGTGARTRYAAVVPATLDDVGPGTFIGTAVKGPPDRWVAVEIVIVPEPMRAGRRGCYAWDPLPDTSGIPAPAAGAPPPSVETSMTNGSVVRIDAGGTGRVLTVGLVGRGTAEVAASPTVPVTRFVPARRSAVAAGSTAVVWTGRGGGAVLVAVGRGVAPPM